MMVAAHNGDLAAARDAGLQTAFVPRITEYGPARPRPRARRGWDMIANDFMDLASNFTMNADRIIETLGLSPHPEGGHYRQTWVPGRR
jgi:hypothetical protein